MSESAGVLLDYHDHSDIPIEHEQVGTDEQGRPVWRVSRSLRQSESVVATIGADGIRLAGHYQDPYLVTHGDGSLNEFDWADVVVAPDEFADRLCRAQMGESWKCGPLTLSRDSLAVGSGSYSAPGCATARLDRSRSTLLTLDACEVAFSAANSIRTGSNAPTSGLDGALLAMMREEPELVGSVRPNTLRKIVQRTLSERSGATVTLEPVIDGGNFWIVQSSNPRHAPMLLALEPGKERSVELTVLDRINGLRDRSGLTKSVVVTQSSFDPGALAAYGGRTRQMDLVDFDRLKGVVLDSGWLSPTPMFMCAPILDRAPHKLFVSYSRKQKAFAGWLFRQLNSSPYACFLDEVDLLPGQVLLSALREAIAGVDVVLLCCSRDALASHWVRQEIEACLTSEKVGGRTKLIPLLLESFRFEESYAPLNDRIQADFRGWPNEQSGVELERLRQAIELHIAR